MSRKKVAQQEEDDFEFLMQKVAENQAKKAIEEESKKIPEEVFKDLPDPPNRENGFSQRAFLEYNEQVGHRPNTEQEARLAELKESLPDYREAGIIHQKVREWAMNSQIIRPGVVLYDACNEIEEGVRRMVQFDPPVRGLAFPCGCSINHCAAHYSPLPGDNTILHPSDVMKIDYGVAVNGKICDSAFSVCFDERFKPLIDATIDATNTGVRMAGPDAILNEIGDSIEEVISSYSMELNGKTYQIRPVSNLMGHQVGHYKVHCGKSIPICREKSEYRDSTQRMEYGDVFALETFATTGEGFVYDDGATSHFMVNPKAAAQKSGPQRKLMDFLTNNFKTLAFCQRFIERGGESNYTTALQQLVRNKAVNAYPPLSDVVGSYVSQHEHTFAILENGKEVFSRD